MHKHYLGGSGVNPCFACNKLFLEIIYINRNILQWECLYADASIRRSRKVHQKLLVSLFSQLPLQSSFLARAYNVDSIDKGLNHPTSGERKAYIGNERKSLAYAVKVPTRIRNLSKWMGAVCITTELYMCSQILSITTSQISHSIWQHSLNQKFKIVIVNNKRKH